jgi:hypothetical protein
MLPRGVEFLVSSRDLSAKSKLTDPNKPKTRGAVKALTHVDIGTSFL